MAYGSFYNMNKNPVKLSYLSRFFTTILLVDETVN